VSKLTNDDLTMFNGLGVNPALLDLAKIDRVTDAEARELGLTGGGDLAGIIFPYRSGNETRYFRVRRDHPGVGEDGKYVAKYMAPANGPDLPRHLYYPPVSAELLGDKTVPVVLVESEKASLALTAWAERTDQHYVTIAMGGCYGWSAGKDEKTGEKILHTDLQVCRDRRTHILMDSNSATSANVRRARRELAAALSGIGSQIQILDLPSVDGCNGPDDFVGRQGDQALANLFDSQLVGAAVLADVEKFISKFMVMTESQRVAVTLWAAHTHGLDGAIFTPYLAITSAEKQCAKSRLLEALEYVVHSPWKTSGATAAALFRKIDFERPTLLLDEVDSTLKADREMAEAIRGVLCAGNKVGATFSRCVGKGTEMLVRDFNVFCPKALAGIGGLPDTVRDRSIPIRLQRKLVSQKTERLRRRLVQAEADALRERLANWVQGQVSRLKDATPLMPEELSDRQQDGSEILFSIAEAAGGDWPERTRKALLELFTSEDVADDSLRMRLLADLRDIFNQFPKADILSTDRLIEQLRDIETSPWVDLNNGRGLTPKGMADKLKPFGIRPGQYQEGGSRTRGYRRSDLMDAWIRYLPSIPNMVENNPSTRAEAKIHGCSIGEINPSAAPLVNELKSELLINEYAGSAHVLGSETEMIEVSTESAPGEIIDIEAAGWRVEYGKPYKFRSAGDEWMSDRDFPRRRTRPRKRLLPEGVVLQ